MKIFRTLLTVVFLCVLGVSSRTCTARTNYSSNEFNDLNQFFRREYAKSRLRKLEGVDPIVIVRGDYLVLIHNGKRQEGSRVNPHYHDLKALSHIPLAFWLGGLRKSLMLPR